MPKRNRSGNNKSKYPNKTSKKIKHHQNKQKKKTNSNKKKEKIIQVDENDLDENVIQFGYGYELKYQTTSTKNLIHEIQEFYVNNIRKRIYMRSKTFGIEGYKLIANSDQFNECDYVFWDRTKKEWKTMDLNYHKRDIEMILHKLVNKRSVDFRYLGNANSPALINVNNIEQPIIPSSCSKKVKVTILLEDGGMETTYKKKLHHEYTYLVSGRFQDNKTGIEYTADEVKKRESEKQVVDQSSTDLTSSVAQSGRCRSMTLRSSSAPTQSIIQSSSIEQSTDANETLTFEEIRNIALGEIVDSPLAFH